MAEERPADSAPPPYFDFADPNIQTVYANRATALIGESDISLFFGIDILEPDREVGKLSTRVVMSHARFMLLMEFLATRYDVLNTMYRGAPPSLNYIAATDPEHAKNAWQKLSGTQNEQSEQKEAENGVSPSNNHESSY